MVQASLSDFWREKRSSDQTEELALVLKFAKGFISLFGEGYEASWRNQSHVSSSGKVKTVTLDYSPIKNKLAPFDGSDIDMIMGEAIHESGHIKYSYSKKELIETAVKQLKIRPYALPQEIHHCANIIEDFYIENKVSEDNPTLGLYLKDAKRHYAKTANIPQWLVDDLRQDSPSKTSIITAWGLISLQDWNPPKNISENSRKILTKLVNNTIEAARSDTHKKRIKLSLNSYTLVSALDIVPKPKSPEPEENLVLQAQGQENSKEAEEKEDESNGYTDQDDSISEQDKPESQEDLEDTESLNSQDNQELEDGESPGYEESEYGAGEGDKEEDKEGEKASGESSDEEIDSGEIGIDKEQDNYQGETLDELQSFYTLDSVDKLEMPRGLAEIVGQFLETAQEDLSSEVQSALGGVISSCQIIMAQAPRDEVKAKQLMSEALPVSERIAKVFDWDKKQRTRKSHGQLEGTIDQRRLFRAGINDQRFFSQKDVLSAPSLGVAILVDSSGSMKDKIDFALSIAAALKLALARVPNTQTMVASYTTGDMDGISIYRIYDRATDFRPGRVYMGYTPSGEAIAAIALRMDKFVSGKDKLIIHVTDGEPRPSTHETVKEAVKFCNQHNIEVITIMVNCASEAAIDSYHGLAQEIRDIKELPDAIISLLKKRLTIRRVKL